MCRDPPGGAVSSSLAPPVAHFDRPAQSCSDAKAQHRFATGLYAAERIPSQRPRNALRCSNHIRRRFTGVPLGGAGFETADDAQLQRFRPARTAQNSYGGTLQAQRLLFGPTSFAVARRRSSLFWIPPIWGISGPHPWLRVSIVLALWTETKPRDFMLNELYLSCSYWPMTGVATGPLSRALAKAQRDGRRVELEDSLDICEKLSQTLAASLARYEPEKPGPYRDGKIWRSSLLEYLALLINGESQRMPLPRGPLNQALAGNRFYFGTEARVPIAYSDPGGGNPRHQRVPDTDDRGHV